MSRSLVARSLALAGIAAAAVSLAACSSSNGFADRSDYVSPIAATAAPPPPTPVAYGSETPRGRRPLLPPVPEDRETGLPPVTVAALLPPPVR